MSNPRARLVSVLAASMLAAGLAVMPLAPSLADDPTPAATPTPDPTPAPTPCDSLHVTVAVLAREVGAQEQDIQSLHQIINREQAAQDRAWRIVARKNLRIAKLERRIRQMQTGLHG